VWTARRRELEAMWVDKSLRGRGLGRVLMTAAEDEGRQRGCVLVEFCAYVLLAPAARPSTSPIAAAIMAP
jgi:GNAT superfamily N-acetyltransferase